MFAAPYKKLFTFWFAVIIYDLTVRFTEKFIKSWKLKEQMDGAARAAKQNIVEGSESLKTSLKSGIKLTNVAKASMEEEIGDLEDFARQRRLKVWDKDGPRVRILRARSARVVRNLSSICNLRDPVKQDQEEAKLLAQFDLPDDPEKAVNLLLTLAHQASYLLSKQVESLERKHETEGGYTEKLYEKRYAFRSRKFLK